MDIVFNCSKCDVELAVDASGAGSAINCPECGEAITIPAAPAESSSPPPPPVASSAPPPPSAPTTQAAMDAAIAGHAPINAIASSAAAKVTHHFSVPTSNKPVQALVTRAIKPIEETNKGGPKRIKVKTIRHSDCIEVGHDIFDQTVSAFIEKIGDTNIVSINPVNYSHTEHGGDRLVSDYGLVIIYKG